MGQGLSGCGDFKKTVNDNYKKEDEDYDLDSAFSWGGLGTFLIIGKVPDVMRRGATEGNPPQADRRSCLFFCILRLLSGKKAP
ncbi:MAG: hypothetical protein JRJ60_09850 [Deltaproteobacteria bacterium]|nr:hypothetical protein [Deltaproteobacteria bacterium]